MDTSNSQNKEGKNNQILRYLLGLEKPDIGSYSVEDWFFIANVVRDMCKPYLKYFDDFVELKKLYDIRNDNEYFGSHMIIPTSVIHKPSSLTGDTRLLFFDHFFSDLEFGKGACDYPDEAKAREEKRLLITQDGQWVLWEARFVRKVLSGDRSLPRSSRIEERAKILFLQYISDGALKDLIEKHDLGRRILGNLTNVLRKSIEQKRQRLVNLVLLHERMIRVTQWKSMVIG